MGGPWENYQSADASAPADGPWTNYATPSNGAQPSSWQGNVAAVARPILEMGGAVGGSLLTGGPETPVGIAGGAVGYGAGKAAADLLSRSLGVQQPIQSIPQAIGEAGSDLKSGAQLEAANLLVNPAIKGLGKAALKGASAYFGPSEEAIQARLANPSAISQASFPKTADDLASHLNDLQTNLNKIEEKVWGSLLKLKAEPKSTLMGMVNNLKGQYNVTNGPVVGDARKAAVSALDNLAQDINSYKQKGIDPSLEQFFDQKQLRQIIQSVSEDINWADPSATSKNEALTSFRHYLSEYLKGENPTYAGLIQQSADRTALLANVEKTFGLKKVSGEFVPGDMTAGKIESLLKPNKIQSQQVAQQVKNLTGLDIQNAAQSAKYAGEFEKTATQGSRRANIGAVLGAALGAATGHSVEGAAIGAGAGGYADKYAAQNLGSVIDYLNRIGLSQGANVNPLTSLGMLAAVKGSKD